MGHPDEDLMPAIEDDPDVQADGDEDDDVIGSSKGISLICPLTQSLFIDPVVK